jgi:hypothetical protein
VSIATGFRGEILYKLYRAKVIEEQAGWGANVVSLTQSQGQPGPMPMEWRALGEKVQRFWNELATEYDHATN